MRLQFLIAALLFALTCSAGADVTSPKKSKSASSRKLGLSIRVEGGGWGSARQEQIETVLYAVADELMPRLPQKLTTPIVVTHTDSNPVALYDRGPAGEYLVRLHASGQRWYLYAYEFAHEFCHIMSNYEENVGAGTSKHNQWFEETLCETASLFALKSLAATWEEAPPSPEWSEQVRHLRSFFNLLVNEGHRHLPPHMPLTAWLGDNEERLRRDPYQREKNELLANRLLPFFERNPEHWDALCYLNLDPGDHRNSLEHYLRNWYDNAPGKHKAFLVGLLDLLGVQDLPPLAGVDVPPAAPLHAVPAAPVPASAGAAGRSAP